jgi:DNA-binding NtrC family response regulator
MTFAPILVVDSEPESQMAASSVLMRAGYAVECTADAEEAISRIERRIYGLVIADANVHPFSGIEMLRRVQKLGRGVPVVLTTACGSVNHAVEAMQAGAVDYLLKPFSEKALETVIQQAAATGSGKRCDEVMPEQQIITEAPGMLSVLELAKNVASSRTTILIQGESGTGKELLAAYIHRHSRRPEEPYVAVNCAALPESLAESELFGHEKGAFTGAVQRKAGKFELAGAGTVVLDEISEMPLPLQAKLLRVLQERQVDRVGGTRPVPVQARVIAISNVDLKRAVLDGDFREDLYYRINVLPLSIPPLRERKCDIPLLAEHFLKKFAALNGRSMRCLAKEALSMLIGHDWKGNVRELENTVERAVLIGAGETLLPEHLILEPSRIPGNPQDRLAVPVGTTVREMERALIVKTLREVHDNRTRAAEILGISIRTLRNKLREYRTERTVSAAHAG